MSKLLTFLTLAAAPGAENVQIMSDASGRWLEYGLLGLSVSAIMCCAAIATAMAQKAIGPAAIGAAAEDKSLRGTAILLIAIPETILIISAGIAYMLLQKVQ